MSSVKIVEAGRALTLSSLVCSPLAETLLASSSSFSSNEEGTGLRGNRKSAAPLRGEGGEGMERRKAQFDRSRGVARSRDSDRFEEDV